MRFALFALIVSLAAGCGGDDSPTAPTEVTGTAPYSATDLVVGSGAAVRSGDRITADYSLWLYSDTAAENKGRHVQTARSQFTIGTGAVIRAWDQGVPGTQVGGRRRIVAPPELAYGANPPAGSTIPPNATLVFEVAVVSIP